MKFNKKIDTIFLDLKTKHLELDKQVNIILSPSLYWVKKLSLPIKSVREVKKLLPSIFEDSISGGEYSYEAYKAGDDYFVFAYEDKRILELLKEKNISPSSVKKIYFAQSELSDITKPLKIDDEFSLAIQNDIVLLLPNGFIQDAQEINLSNIKHSKYNITLTSYSHIVNKKTLYSLSAILVGFIGLVFGEYMLYSNKVQKVDNQKSEVFTKYSLKPTMFQNNSLLKKYNKIYKRETQLRKYSAEVFATKLKPEHKLTSLILKDKKLVATFSGVKKNGYNYILKKFDAKSLKVNHYFKNKTFYMEMPL